MNFLRRYAGFVLRSLLDCRRYLSIVLGLFVLGLIVGILEHQAVASMVQETIKNLLGRFQEARGAGLFLRIFLHNFTAAVGACASGLLFGIFPVFSSFLNGMFIGAVLAGVQRYTHLSLYQVLLSLLPHGIFELPAFFLALALGLRLGTWPFQKEKRRFLTEFFNGASAIFFKIILPFLIVAAAIETTGIELLR